MKRIVTFLVIFFTIVLVFAYGVGVGQYKWPPFYVIRNVKHFLDRYSAQYTDGYKGEQELLQYAFTDPVNENELYYPSITTLEGIREANQGIFMQREGFEAAYDDLELLGVDQVSRPEGTEPVVRVRFRYQGREHEAFAYGTLPVAAAEAGTASLIIPGSGLNQSLGIATRDPANYHHGILDALNKGGGGDIFTLIKPNEDFLAWHDGEGSKLTGSFIWNWHLNRGGSYSVSYLVQSLAFTKWMQKCFENSIIVGLSQGGAAALLNSIQSEPTVAIVASGHTVLSKIAHWSGPAQLIGVPGFADLSEKSTLIPALNNTETHWFFSWGHKERGTYRIEAEEGVTAKWIGPIDNVTVVRHDDGHEFPVSYIVKFLNACL